MTVLTPALMMTIVDHTYDPSVLEQIQRSQNTHKNRIVMRGVILLMTQIYSKFHSRNKSTVVCHCLLSLSKHRSKLCPSLVWLGHEASLSAFLESLIWSTLIW